jgi:hypothetical protein
MPFTMIFKESQAFLVVFLRRPEAVTACLILVGPVLRFADDFFSAAVILAATAFGLQEG